MQAGKMGGAICALVIWALAACGCGALARIPMDHNFRAPEVTVDRIEVDHYWGWWYFPGTMEPALGDAGDYGAPLSLAVLFKIHNPNRFPVRLEHLNFTLAFEALDLKTIHLADPQWIPPNKTNHLRVNALCDARQVLLNLTVTGGGTLPPGDLDPFAQLESWWRGIQAFSFPICVREGSAVFTAGMIARGAAFEGVYPRGP